MNWIDKYGELLATYSLYLKPGELVFVRATTLAESLVKSFYKHATKLGAIVEVEWIFEGQQDILLEYGNEAQLKYVNPRSLALIQECNAYILIRAPFQSNKDMAETDPNKVQLLTEANAAFSKIYFERLGNGSLKRSLCQFPTQQGADQANMSLDEYATFIQKACFLDREQPAEHWLGISKMQQGIVDYLNPCKVMRYEHQNWSIEFGVEGRIWINSDGKSNMPSGEVFTSPIEDSVNGTIHFDYPTIMFGKDVQGITLEVKDGVIQSWSVNVGQEVLDQVFAIEGTRVFGEAAIGTNPNIQQATKNILFDEKIGGTVHMAVGQSYYQCGGKNKSSVHWDLITNMKNGGSIYADGKKIYENGQFLIG